MSFEEQDSIPSTSSPNMDLAHRERQEDEEIPLPADDFQAMLPRVLPVDPELETIDEGYYNWSIDDWAKLPHRITSPSFECAGTQWSILLFPTGNNTTRHVSCYFALAPESQKPEDFYVCAQFCLVLWKSEDPTNFHSIVANHRYNTSDSDWGFTQFFELQRLFPRRMDGNGPVKPDTVNITAYVRVVKDPTGVLWHNLINYNSKKEIGMVGLYNQGATCYFNSFLQSLYFTNLFRKIVYDVDTREDVAKSKVEDCTYALQRLFYRLTTSDRALHTTELTRALGFTAEQIYHHQDVDECTNWIFDRLEEKVKKTPLEQALNDLFQFKARHFIHCVDVTCPDSITPENHWKMFLFVQGRKTLENSLKEYVTPYLLDEPYQSEQFGRQRAEKGVHYDRFPHVLFFNLLRVGWNEYGKTKFNDRFEFPEEFDAAPYLSKDADKSESWKYKLYGVVVHEGDSDSGHYYAFLRTEKDGRFYKFDDEKVIPATKKEAIEDNFGGSEPTLSSVLDRPASAAMLFYFREAKVDEIMRPITDDDIPSYLKQKLEDERLEQIRFEKEREEERLNLNVHVLSEETFRNHKGFDLTYFQYKYPEVEEQSKSPWPTIYRVRRTACLGDFTAKLAEELGKKPDQLVLWAFIRRQNRTYRPEGPLTDLNMRLEDILRDVNSHGRRMEKSLYLYLEVLSDDEETANGEAETNGPAVHRSPQLLSYGHTLLFLKYFDYDAQELRSICQTYVRRTSKVSELIPFIRRRMSWGEDVPVQLYEEVHPNMIEARKTSQTFEQAEIQSGDIICFEKAKRDEASAFKYQNAVEFYRHLEQEMAFSP